MLHTLLVANIPCKQHFYKKIPHISRVSYRQNLHTKYVHREVKSGALKAFWCWSLFEHMYVKMENELETSIKIKTEQAIACNVKCVLEYFLCGTITESALKWLCMWQKKGAWNCLKHHIHARHMQRRAININIYKLARTLTHSLAFTIYAYM